MITTNEIRPYRKTAIDFVETEKIKNRLNTLKQLRSPFYLDSNDFEAILKWKLRNQYMRLKKIMYKNTDEIIKNITEIALNISHKNKDYEIELRLKLLTVLGGVGIPVASAILALCFPNQYAVIDFRAWRRLFEIKKRAFSFKDYIKYLNKIKFLANELGWLPQEVDLAIWEYDRKNSGK